MKVYVSMVITPFGLLHPKAENLTLGRNTCNYLLLDKVDYGTPLNFQIFMLLHDERSKTSLQSLAVLKRNETLINVPYT
jgi:hypothetical protein